MDIVRATDVDADAILILQKQCYQSEAALYNDYGIPPLKQTIEDLRKEIASIVVLKALDREEIIGSVRGYAENGNCFIGRLIVHPDRQNKGIGKRLMSAIEEHFKDARRYELFTGDRSEKNLSLYAKLGYHEFTRKPLGGEVMLVYMEKMTSGRTGDGVSFQPTGNQQWFPVEKR